MACTLRELENKKHFHTAQPYAANALSAQLASLLQVGNHFITPEVGAKVQIT